jgi:hypothetical protein
VGSAKKKKQSSLLAFYGFMIGVPFHPEAGGSTFLKNIGEFIQDCMSRFYRVLTMVYNTQNYWGFGQWIKSETPVRLYDFTSQNMSCVETKESI